MQLQEPRNILKITIKMIHYAIWFVNRKRTIAIIRGLPARL